MINVLFKPNAGKKLFMKTKDVYKTLNLPIMEMTFEDGLITQIDETAKSLFPLEVGKKFDDFLSCIHPMHYDRLLEAIDVFKETKQHYTTVEFTVPQMNGESAYIDARFYRDDTSQDTSFQILAIDVSRHRRHVNNYKYMLDSSPTPVVVHRGHNICYANPAFLTLANIGSINDLLAQPAFNRLVLPKDVSKINRYITDRMRKKEVKDELTFFLAVGQYDAIPVSCKVDVIDWEAEPAFLSTITPLEEPPQQSESRSKVEALLQHVFDVTPDMIMVLEKSSRSVIMANNRLLEACSYSRDEIVGKNPFSAGLLKPLKRADSDLFQELEREGLVQDQDAMTKTKLGREINSSLSLSKCPVGEEEFYICVMRDVTDRYEQAENIKRSMFMAEETNRKKSEFLANMSHELRTPLNAILGFAQMIKNKIFGDDTDRYANYANDIHHSGIHLLNIINDILDLSKVEAGAMDMQGEAVNVKKCFEEVQRINGQTALDNDLHLQIDCPDDQLYINANKQRFLQVLINIVSNSLKFTPEGGTISVKATRVYNQDKVRIWISDTGIGMSEAEIKTAMEPFGQGNQTYNRGHQGTGLGMPLVNSFTKAMGGKMTIKSSPGMGTTINLVFHMADNSVKGVNTEAVTDADMAEKVTMPR